MSAGTAAPAQVAARAAGLTAAEAAARLERDGPNRLIAPEGPHWARRIARNFTHLFALLLWAGAALAWPAGMPELSVAIVAVILVNATFSFVQEYRAERAVGALRQMLPQRVRVRRGDRQVEVAAEDVVVGDLVLLAAGDRVAADARLTSRTELRADMSALTGESVAVPRRSGGPDDLAQLFAGTFVVAGAGEAVVSATGMATELGHITALTQGAARHPSPMELQMARITRVVAVLSVTLGGLFFLAAGALGMDTTDRLLFAIGVIVANVPEGLLPTVTLSLAMATQRMARRNALVRQLSAVEALGEATVICTDKTGTLTANEMTVRRLWTPAGTAEVEGTGYEPAGSVHPVAGSPRLDDLRALALAAALCNDAALHRTADGWQMVGDPTEGALLTLARKLGLDPEEELRRRPRLSAVPFDSERKRMSTVHADGGALTAYVKGAPASVIDRCRLDDTTRREASAAAEAMARASLRVLAVARREGADPDAGAEVEHDLELLGLVGMEDPPRAEVAPAVARCRHAGIRVIIVTGDHAATAEAVARRTGVIDGPARVLDGAGLDALDDAALLGGCAGRTPSSRA